MEYHYKQHWTNYGEVLFLTPPTTFTGFKLRNIRKTKSAQIYVAGRVIILIPTLLPQDLGDGRVACLAGFCSMRTYAIIT